MTVPTEPPAPPEEDPVLDAPEAPGAAVVAVLAAFVVGVGAVGASSVLSSAWPRLLVAVGLVVFGGMIARSARAGHPYHPLALALGGRVLGGIGTSLAVLGAYLGGLAVLTVLAENARAAPSAVTVVLIVYGPPLAALCAVAVRGSRAWLVGAGVLAPMTVVLLMVAAESGSGRVSVFMLALAVVLTALVLTAGPGVRWPDAAAPAAAMAVSFAFGAGTSPFGALGATQVGGAVGGEATGGLTGAASVVVAAGALLVAVVLLLVAVRRRDVATGVLAGCLFVMPPVRLMIPLPPGGAPGEVEIALVGVPVLVAMVALAAIRLLGLRRRLVPLPDADAAAACAVVVAGCAVVFLTLAMPVLGWGTAVQGVVALVVLVGAAALGYWLPGRAGAAAAVVALLGLAFAEPWARLPGPFVDAGRADLAVTGVLDLVAAGALAWLLPRRHPHVAVFAAAAYLLLGALAGFVGPLLVSEGFLTGTGAPFDGAWAPVLVLTLPLLLVGIPAAALAFGPRAPAGQAVGAVVLAAAGFLPMTALVGELGPGASSYLARLSLAPLTPTDWLTLSYLLPTVAGPVLVAVAALVALALVLAASLARRPSAPLAAAVALVLLAAVQASLLTVLSEWSGAEAELLGWVLGAVAVVAAVVGTGVVLAARRPAP